MEIRDKIEIRLKADQRSFAWLAGQVGISPQSLNYCLSSGNFPDNVKVKISKILKISIEELFFEENTSSAKTG